MPKFYNTISILAVPTDACNLNCTYCFHKPHFDASKVMSLDTLERTIDLACSEYSSVQFVWHGGEPLLAGVDFYRHAIEFQKKYKDCVVKNRIQCNLTLLNDEYAAFFATNHFGVDSSFDGVCNEITRGNTEIILNNYRRYTSYGQKVGFIMVLSSYTIFSLIESYELFKSIGANFSINNYLPLSFKEEDPFVVEPEVIVERLSELFDYWVNDEFCCIHLNTFEEYLRYFLQGKTNKCRFNSCLGHWICVRPNGQIMPCNRFFPERYSYGNICNIERIGDVFNSCGFKLILSEATKRKESCRCCDLYMLCKGGCNNVAYVGGGVGYPNKIYCYVLREITTHIKTWCDTVDFKRIANPIIRESFSFVEDEGVRNE